MNLMKTGIMFADKITTVSPTYAQEIRWTNNGEGMQEYLSMRAADLIGILNGADYSEWNPSLDATLSTPYGVESLPIKSEAKRELLQNSLPENDDTPELPLIGMVSRLTSQKGTALLESVLEPLLLTGLLRFVVLGSGETKTEQFLRQIGSKYPSRALVKIGYNNTLSHSIIAGSDFLLVPSLFEPCGLTQLYAMKYGTVPIVRATGGLRDTVHEFDPKTGVGNGFVFEHYSANDLFETVLRAISVYNREPHWTNIRENGMRMNYSSERCASEYLQVFRWAADRRRLLSSQ